MKTALILQGWKLKPEQVWYPWLKQQLEAKGFQAYLPDLPTIHTNLPDMNQQLEFIDNTIMLDHHSIVVGHSIGAVLGLRLAEKHQLDRLFLVAGWDFNDLTEEHQSYWPKVIDHTTIEKNVNEIYCLSSDNDPFFTPFTVKQMTQRLNGEFILVKGAGHFGSKDEITDIPQITERIK